MLLLSDFLISTGARVCKSYLWGLAFLSNVIVIIFFAAVKFMLLQVYPQVFNSITIKGFFQLSYFLYVPVVVILYWKKFRMDAFLKGGLPVHNIRYGLSLISFILISLLLLILFTYTLMIW